MVGLSSAHYALLGLSRMPVPERVAAGAVRDVLIGCRIPGCLRLSLPGPFHAALRDRLGDVAQRIDEG